MKWCEGLDWILLCMVHWPASVNMAGNSVKAENFWILGHKVSKENPEPCGQLVMVGISKLCCTVIQNWYMKNVVRKLAVMFEEWFMIVYVESVINISSVCISPHL